MTYWRNDGKTAYDIQAHGDDKTGDNDGATIDDSENDDGGDDETKYEVERILDSRIVDGQLQYQWAGSYGQEEDPKWYAATAFANAAEIVRDYHNANIFAASELNLPHPPA